MLARKLSHSFSALDDLRGISLRPRIGKHQTVHVPGSEAQDRKRDVAAHRQPHHHCLVDVQRVEEIDDIAGIVVRRRPGI